MSLSYTVSLSSSIPLNLIPLSHTIPIPLFSLFNYLSHLLSPLGTYSFSHYLTPLSHALSLSLTFSLSNSLYHSLSSIPTSPLSLSFFLILTPFCNTLSLSHMFFNLSLFLTCSHLFSISIFLTLSSLCLTHSLPSFTYCPFPSHFSV